MLPEQKETNGVPPDLKGMSGCPSFIIKEKDGIIYPMVEGILVEQLRSPPINGRTLVTSSLKHILEFIKNIYLNNTGIKNDL